MTPVNLSLILASVFISALAQVLLKIGLSRLAADPTNPASTASVLAGFLPILSSPLVLAGLLAYGMGALVWLKVLQRFDVSQAYPFVALGIVATMALGILLLHEPMHPSRLIGATLILGGVVLMGLR